MTERKLDFLESHEPKQEKTQPSNNLAFRLALVGPVLAGTLLAACSESRASLPTPTETSTQQPTPIETLIPTPEVTPFTTLVRVDDEVDENGDKIFNIVDLRLQRREADCLACLDINASGGITQMDVDLIQRRIDEQLPFHPRFDPVEPFDTIDDADVEAVSAKVGRVVPSEAGGLKLNEVYYGWKLDKLEVAIKLGTGQEEIARLENKYNLTLPSASSVGAYITIPKGVNFGELVAELMQEESISFVDRISIGTIE